MYNRVTPLQKLELLSSTHFFDRSATYSYWLYFFWSCKCKCSNARRITSCVDRHAKLLEQGNRLGSCTGCPMLFCLSQPLVLPIQMDFQTLAPCSGSTVITVFQLITVMDLRHARCVMLRWPASCRCKCARLRDRGVWLRLEAASAAGECRQQLQADAFAPAYVLRAKKKTSPHRFAAKTASARLAGRSSSPANIACCFFGVSFWAIGHKQSPISERGKRASKRHHTVGCWPLPFIFFRVCVCVCIDPKVSAV